MLFFLTFLLIFNEKIAIQGGANAYNCEWEVNFIIKDENIVNFEGDIFGIQLRFLDSVKRVKIFLENSFEELHIDVAKEIIPRDESTYRFYEEYKRGDHIFLFPQPFHKKCFHDIACKLCLRTISSHAHQSSIYKILPFVDTASNIPTTNVIDVDDEENDEDVEDEDDEDVVFKDDDDKEKDVVDVDDDDDNYVEPEKSVYVKRAHKGIVKSRYDFTHIPEIKFLGTGTKFRAACCVQNDEFQQIEKNVHG